MDTQQLERVLEAEASGFAAFVTRLPLKLAIIKKGQVGPLNQLVAREEAEQKALRQLERERIALSAELAAKLGLREDAPIKEIIAVLPAQEAQRLRELADRLVTLAGRLKEGNDRCALLLQASLDFVRFSMEVYGRFLNPEERLADMLYGPAATGTGSPSNSLLNRSA